MSSISQPFHMAALGRPTMGANGPGTWYVFTVPMLAVIGIMRGYSFGIGEYNYTGFLWLGALFAGLFLFAAEKGMRPLNQVYFPVAPWIVWLLLVWSSFAWSDNPGQNQLREAVQLCMPVFTAVMASLFIRTRAQLAQLLRVFHWTVPFMALAVAGWLSGLDYDLRDDVFVEVRSLATTSVIVGAVFVAGTRSNPLRGWLGWLACLAMPAATGGRIGTLAVLMLPIFNPIGASFRRKLTAMVVVGVLAVGMFLTPTFQQRFFDEGSGSISDVVEGDFDSRGRFDVWPMLFDEALERPWLGHGVGAGQLIVPSLWNADVSFPHNDYLRIGYEYGGIGLFVFLCVLCWQIWSIAREIRRTSGIVQQAFAAAWIGWVAFLPIAFTDNPITYILFFMDPLFAIMGAAYGVARWEEQLAAREITAGSEVSTRPLTLPLR